MLRRGGIDLPPLSVDTLQVNITKLCNQVCRHCHVDASPARKEMLSPEGVAKCLEILERHAQITKLDITGGAPELHPGFDAFVERAVALGKHVMVRHNLTVQIDGNPQTGEQGTAQFFARNGRIRRCRTTQVFHTTRSVVRAYSRRAWRQCNA